MNLHTFKKLTFRMYLAYLKYVLRHKWFVFLECCRLGLYWQGITHDLSKFSKEEWVPYVYKFFGPYEVLPEALEEMFDEAWKLHYLNNPHHWEFWVFPEEVLDMPLDYRKEMLADWIGFGKMRGRNDSKEFYLAKKDEIKLHPETRKWIEKALGINED